MKRAIALAALAAAQSAQAAETRFTTCPIYRDTDAGRKSGCWLADESTSGTRFDVSQAPTKPDWNYAILVEGKVADKQDNPCGGTVLDPVRVSVLDDRCPRHMIPAEGFPGRKFVLPRRNVSPSGDPRPVDPPPYGPRTFSIFFDFDRAFVTYQLSDWLFDNTVAWLKAAKPRRIVVTGFAVTDRGESANIARDRATRIAQSLAMLGIPGARVKTGTNPPPTTAEGSDGLTEPSRRRVEVTATF